MRFPHSKSSNFFAVYSTILWRNRGALLHFLTDPNALPREMPGGTCWTGLLFVPAPFSVNPQIETSHPTDGCMTGPNSTSRGCIDCWRMAAIVLLISLPAVLHAQQASSKAATNQGRVERGKYIVEGVAMCGVCHTPRNGSGGLERGQWLDGAALWLLPAGPAGDWPLKAPRIAGSPAASDDDLIRLLTTGIWKTGARLRDPMPQFRMTREDAEAVVAYLRSLTPRAGD